jgi:hypothetical protein
LLTGDVRIAGDRFALPKGEQPSTASITLPQVRVRTGMQLSYRVIERTTERELERGEVAIQVFPAGLLKDAADRFAQRRLIVLGEDVALSEVLRESDIEHRAVAQPSELAFTQPSVILVAADALKSDSFAQQPLTNLARNGSSILILSQGEVRNLMGYPLVRRPAGGRLQWRMDHPLLRSLTEVDAQSWLSARGLEVRAVQLPAEEPALEIAYWPAEVESREPRPIDALLVSKTVGEGRVVLCQVPLGDWRTDPRSQMLLANALDYLQTRPEPTPPAGRRGSETIARPIEVPTITVPAGASP